MKISIGPLVAAFVGLVLFLNHVPIEHVQRVCAVVGSLGIVVMAVFQWRRSKPRPEPFQFFMTNILVALSVFFLLARFNEIADGLARTFQ